MVRYVAVGVACAIGYFLVAAALHRYFGWGLQASNLLAILLMHPCSYLGHRHITFQHAGPWLQSLRRFAAMACLSTAVSMLTSWLQDAMDVSVIAGLLVNCVAIPAITFLTLKLWVFAPALIHRPQPTSGALKK